MCMRADYMWYHLMPSTHCTKCFPFYPVPMHQWQANRLSCPAPLPLVVPKVIMLGHPNKQINVLKASQSRGFTLYKVKLPLTLSLLVKLGWEKSILTWKIHIETLNIIQNDAVNPVNESSRNMSQCIVLWEILYVWPAGQRFEDRERKLEFKVTAV